jgi:predicted small metal-binding protein
MDSAALNRLEVVIRRLGVKKNSRPLQSPPSVDVTDIEVYRFQCGHEDCGSQLTASTKDEIMLLIAQHLKDAHSVNNVTNTLMSYLESTCVTVRLA